MSDNVLIAVIAGSAVVIGALATSLVAAMAIHTGNKRLNGIDARLDRIDGRLGLIEQDLKEFFKDITRLKTHTKLD